MIDNPPPKNVKQKLKSFEGIFGLVLLGVSILGLIFTLTLPWFSYEITIEYDEDYFHYGFETGENKETHKESYDYSDLDSRSIGNYLENGAVYVLIGFIALIVLSLVYLFGLFSSFLHLPTSMLFLGLDRNEPLSSRHLRSLKSIAALLMWFPTVLIVYGSARFVGTTHLENSNLEENVSVFEMMKITGGYSTACGYLFFILGFLMLGGLCVFYYKLWLKPVVYRAGNNLSLRYVKRISWLSTSTLLLLTLGLILMPVFSIAVVEYNFEGSKTTFYYNDGFFYNVEDSMEEKGTIDREWEDVSDDLSMMFWCLFYGIILCLFSLIGVSIFIANPKYNLARVLQWCMVLVAVAGIIFMIGHIMLWTDIPDLDPPLSQGNDNIEYSFGNNYFPFVFSLLALVGSIWASIVIIPYSIGAYRGVDYGEAAAFGTPEAGTFAEETPGGAPFAGMGRAIKAHKKPVFISIGVVVLLVAGIVIYYIAVPDDGSKGKAGDDNAGVPGDLSGYVFNNGGDSIQGYADETSPITTTIYIEPVNVAYVQFTLYWSDESDADPRHTNQPDEFTLMVENPDGSFSDVRSGSNPLGGEGNIQLEFHLMDPSTPPEEMPDMGGTGDWQVTISVNSGDQEPIIPGPGNLRTFQDRGNDFSMEISYGYYTLPEERN